MHHFQPRKPGPLLVVAPRGAKDPVYEVAPLCLSPLFTNPKVSMGSNHFVFSTIFS